MFIRLFLKRKKMYKIVYQQLNTYTTIIEARDEFQALKKFRRMTQYGITPSIISFEEYKLEEYEF